MNLNFVGKIFDQRTLHDASGNSYTSYTIKVICKIDGKLEYEWFVSHRFNDFYENYQILHHEYQLLRDFHFPEKHRILFSVYEDDRMIKLQSYIDTILKLEPIPSSVKSFLSFEKLDECLVNNVKSESAESGAFGSDETKSNKNSNNNHSIDTILTTNQTEQEIKKNPYPQKIQSNKEKETRIFSSLHIPNIGVSSLIDNLTQSNKKLDKQETKEFFNKIDWNVFIDSMITTYLIVLIFMLLLFIINVVLFFLFLFKLKGKTYMINFLVFFTSKNLFNFFFQ
jgi:hypothetical protein